MGTIAGGQPKYTRDIHTLSSERCMTKEILYYMECRQHKVCGKCHLVDIIVQSDHLQRSVANEHERHCLQTALTK